jgi:hypothetical protein
VCGEDVSGAGLDTYNKVVDGPFKIVSMKFMKDYSKPESVSLAVPSQMLSLIISTT